MAQYNLFFVPHLEDKNKISKLRLKICKKVYTTQALQFPVHMSLISGGFKVKNYSAFEKDLKKFCSKQKKMVLKSDKMTSVLPYRFWTGLHLIPVSKIRKFQAELQKVREKHAIIKKKHPFYPPHITLAFPADVHDLKPVKNPVTSMKFDRVTIVKKNLGSYRIFKHIKFG